MLVDFCEVKKDKNYELAKVRNNLQYFIVTRKIPVFKNGFVK